MKHKIQIPKNHKVIAKIEDNVLVIEFFKEKTFREKLKEKLKIKKA